jgi:hypothetical protein
MFMSLINKITKKISGVEQSRNALDDSQVRLMLQQYSEFEKLDGNFEISNRYLQCSICPLLKEEFKLFGKTIKDETPVCGECGCNLLLKIPMQDMDCPIAKW